MPTRMHPEKAKRQHLLLNPILALQRDPKKNAKREVNLATILPCASILGSARQHGVHHRRLHIRGHYAEVVHLDPSEKSRPPSALSCSPVEVNPTNTSMHVPTSVILWVYIYIYVLRFLPASTSWIALSTDAII